jgi:DNA-binding winged helix-turn-helix (wHTH) protein
MVKVFKIVDGCCLLLGYIFVGNYNHQDSKEHSKKTGSAPPSRESNSHVPGQQQKINHKKTPYKNMGQPKTR